MNRTRVIVPPERETLEHIDGVWQHRKLEQEKLYPDYDMDGQPRWSLFLNELSEIKPESRTYTKQPQEKMESMPLDDDDRVQNFWRVIRVLVALIVVTYFLGWWSFGFCFPVGPAMQFCF